jgi:hypothetical protein
VIIADVVTLYGLCAYGSNADADAVLTDADGARGSLPRTAPSTQDHVPLTTFSIKVQQPAPRRAGSRT